MVLFVLKSEDMRLDDDEEFEGLSPNQPILNTDKTKNGKRNLIIAKVFFILNHLS